MKKEFYLKRAGKNNLSVFGLVVIATLCFYFGCNNNSINEDTAVKVYVEKLITQESYPFNVDSLQIHQQKIYSKYNTTQREFENYLKSIGSDAAKWQSFFKKSDQYLSELKKKGVVN